MLRRENMRSAFIRSLAVLSLLAPFPAEAQSASGQGTAQQGGDFSSNLHPTEQQKVPAGVIIVKGAWSSASDSVTPLPEGWSLTNNVFNDTYFGITYTVPLNWAANHNAPPPSDAGFYKLAFIRPTPAFKGIHGSIAIFAQDMFFTQLSATNAQELVNYKKDNLQADYKMELQPSTTKI